MAITRTRISICFDLYPDTGEVAMAHIGYQDAFPDDPSNPGYTPPPITNRIGYSRDDFTQGEQAMMDAIVPLLGDKLDADRPINQG